MNLKIEQAFVKYSSKVALDKFTYTFEPSKIYCILGPNGCGKTTLVKLIAEKYASSRKVAYVAQELSGTIGLTVGDIVELGRYEPSRFFTGLDKEDDAKVNKAIEDMSILEFKDRIVDTLSGGEKQRVMISRALAQDTEWTILDEPSSNLDVKHTEMVMSKLKELKENQNKSFIVVLHDINLASRYADTILLMKEGHLVASYDKLNKDALRDVYDQTFEEVKLPSGQSLFYPV